MFILSSFLPFTPIPPLPSFNKRKTNQDPHLSSFLHEKIPSREYILRYVTNPSITVFDPIYITERTYLDTTRAFSSYLQLT